MTTRFGCMRVAAFAHDWDASIAEFDEESFKELDVTFFECDLLDMDVHKLPAVDCTCTSGSTTTQF